MPMINVATKAAYGSFSCVSRGINQAWASSRTIMQLKPCVLLQQMSNVDITLGPEMKSTGEVMCVDYQCSNT